MPEKVAVAERWIDVGGVRTRYLAAGEGVPVLLLHGGHCGDSNSSECAEGWGRNIPAIAEDYACIALDRLGQGLTGNPKRKEDYTMAASVAHAAEFIRTASLAPCHVVGHSRGGYVAARLTLDHPELVRSCTIVSSNTLAPGPGNNEIVFAGNPYPPFSRESARYVLDHYSYSPAHIEEAWLDMRVKSLQSESNRTAAALMVEEALYITQFSPQLQADRRDTHARLARDGLRRPTLVFWSRNDETAPVTMALELFELLVRREPRTELHLVNCSGHFCYRERAPEFNRVIMDFLRRV